MMLLNIGDMKIRNLTMIDLRFPVFSSFGVFFFFFLFFFDEQMFLSFGNIFLLTLFFFFFFVFNLDKGFQ